MQGLDVVVRNATEADVPRLIEIESRWETSPHWTPGNFHSEFGDERRVGWVAQASGRVVGFAFLWLAADEGQIADIAVDPDFARRGIGRRLLRTLLAESRRRGCATVTLEVSAENPAAQALYASEGFSIVGRRSKIYNGAVDAVLMTLRF